MEFEHLIDKESLILDSRRLAEWKRNAGKADLLERIDIAKHKFIEDNGLNWQEMTLICKFIQEIKDII